MLGTIYVQFTVLTLAFIAIVYLTLKLLVAPDRDPWNVLAVFSGLHVLRFGGGLAALAALGPLRMSALLVQVAVGDLVTSLLAVASLMLLLRRSEHALLVTGVMNVFGLVDILAREGWLGYLDLHGLLVRRHFLHVPTVGAALYTSLHLYGFYFIGRARETRRSATV
jgi:hypothetical protein